MYNTYDRRNIIEKIQDPYFFAQYISRKKILGENGKIYFSKRFRSFTTSPRVNFKPYLHEIQTNVLLCKSLRISYVSLI